MINVYIKYGARLFWFLHRDLLGFIKNIFICVSKISYGFGTIWGFWWLIFIFKWTMSKREEAKHMPVVIVISWKIIFFPACVMFVIVRFQNTSGQYNSHFTYFDICKNNFLNIIGCLHFGRLFLLKATHPQIHWKF